RAVVLDLALAVAVLVGAHAAERALEEEHHERVVRVRLRAVGHREAAVPLLQAEEVEREVVVPARAFLGEAVGPGGSHAADVRLAPAAAVVAAQGERLGERPREVAVVAPARGADVPRVRVVVADPGHRLLHAAVAAAEARELVSPYAARGGAAGRAR